MEMKLVPALRLRQFPSVMRADESSSMSDSVDDPPSPSLHPEHDVREQRHAPGGKCDTHTFAEREVITMSEQDTDFDTQSSQDSSSSSTTPEPVGDEGSAAGTDTERAE